VTTVPSRGPSRAAGRAAELRARRAGTSGARGTSSPRLGHAKTAMPPAFLARPHKAKV